MFERAKYKDHGKSDWSKIKDPVATIKYDGANFFLKVENDGSLRFFSRRQSVKGHFPERTEQLPQFASKKLPELAGHVYNVELIHTGDKKSNVESHRAASGILNSLPERSIQTQKDTGPIRAVIHNVVEPYLPTYKDKLLQAKKVQDAFGNPDLLWAAEPHVGPEAVRKLIDHTKGRGQEGVIITSLSTPEEVNHRIKIKHFDTYNLKITDIIQEVDKNGKPKPSMGAVVCVDKSGRVVANVGTGFSAQQRKEIWENPKAWIGQLIQVKTMGLSAQRLRMPVYNGTADGDIDLVV